MSHKSAKLEAIPESIHMTLKSALIRTVAIVACLLWGIAEFIALQRAQRRLRTPSA
jgi:hypothetical protein